MSLPLNLISSHCGFHRRKVVSLAFSPDGDLLLSASLDCTVLIFEVETGRLLAALELDSNENPTCLAWQDRSHFWLGSSDGTMTLWSVNRTTAHSVQLKIANALPFQLPAAPSIICVREEPHDPCSYIVVGYGDSAFEIWGRRGARAAWEAQGHCTSVGPGQPLAAWAILRDAVIVIFRDKGAKVWKFRDDELKSVVGWPAGSSWELAQYLPSNASESSGQARPSAASQTVGHVALIGEGHLQILAFSFEPIPYLALLRTIPIGHGLQSTSGILSNWAGHPILLVADTSDLKAFDLSTSAYQTAVSLRNVQTDATSVNITDICAQTLELKGMRTSVIAAFSGRFGRHVAAAHVLPLGGWGLTVWSATHGSVSIGSLQQRAPKLRFHLEMQKFVAGLSKRASSRQRRRLLGVLILSMLGTLLFLIIGMTVLGRRAQIKALILNLQEWIAPWVFRGTENNANMVTEENPIGHSVIYL